MDKVKEYISPEVAMFGHIRVEFIESSDCEWTIYDRSGKIGKPLGIVFSRKPIEFRPALWAGSQVYTAPQFHEIAEFMESLGKENHD